MGSSNTPGWIHELVSRSEYAERFSANVQG